MRCAVSTHTIVMGHGRRFYWVAWSCCPDTHEEGWQRTREAAQEEADAALARLAFNAEWQRALALDRDRITAW